MFKMQNSLQFGILVLTLTSACVEGMLRRERRFLLNITTEVKEVGPPGSVPGAFSWDFGEGEFAVKDEDETVRKLIQIYDMTTNLGRKKLYLSKTAFRYRNHLDIHPDDPNIEKWKAAAATLTDLHDAVMSGELFLLRSSLDMDDALFFKSEVARDVFEKSLKRGGSAIVRIQQALSACVGALTSLRAVDSTVMVRVNQILIEINDLDETIDEIKEAFEKMIEAAGIKRHS